MPCDYCEEELERGQFVVINGGALLMSDRMRKTGSPDASLDGFLMLLSHDDKNSAYTTVTIADEKVGGQFEFYFCDKSCLIEWFKEKVNNLPERD